MKNIHTQHALSRHDDLLRLLFYRQRPNQRGHFFSSLPFRKLAETLLASPDASVDDLEEELTGARVEDEDRAVLRACISVKISSHIMVGLTDRLGRQVTLERLMAIVTEG